MTSEKTTLAICLLMNSFSQVSFNKNLCDTSYLNFLNYPIHKSSEYNES